MKLGCFSVLLFCTALLLSGCGAREPQEPAETTPPQTAAFTRESKIKDVKNAPMFGSYGRLLFPVEDAYYSGDTLEELQLTYYSHIDPDETLEIVNTLRERAADGQTIFYDIYTDEEKAAAADCLIIDCYGLLSSIYRYADVAYVGGGFGVGIHNVPEAAVYGVPVIIGPNNGKFQEAQALLKNGGVRRTLTASWTSSSPIAMNWKRRARLPADILPVTRALPTWCSNTFTDKDGEALSLVAGACLFFISCTWRF